MTVNKFIYKNESEETVVVLGTRKPHGSNSGIYPVFCVWFYLCIFCVCVCVCVCV